MIKLLIDGYNLLFAWRGTPISTSQVASRLKSERSKLMRLLKEHLENDLRLRTMVVFDSRGALKQTEEERDSASGISIRFAWNFENADALLIELIKKHSSPRQLLVVSSDHQVQTAARRRNARALDAEEFLCLLESGQMGPRDTRVQTKGGMEDQEQDKTDHLEDATNWLKFFGLTSQQQPPIVPNSERHSRRSKVTPPPEPSEHRARARRPLPPGEIHFQIPENLDSDLEA